MTKYTDQERVNIALNEYRYYRISEEVLINDTSKSIGYIADFKDKATALEKAEMKLALANKELETAKANVKKQEQVISNLKGQVKEAKEYLAKLQNAPLLLKQAQEKVIELEKELLAEQSKLDKEQKQLTKLKVEQSELKVVYQDLLVKYNDQVKEEKQKELEKQLEEQKKREQELRVKNLSNTLKEEQEQSKLPNTGIGTAETTLLGLLLSILTLGLYRRKQNN